jgi:CheY-like chemotaxis protein
VLLDGVATFLPLRRSPAIKILWAETPLYYYYFLVWFPLGGCSMKTVMVVDDQASVRQLLEIALKKEGRVILAVDSGEKAIVSAQAKLPDLILMDIMMPGGMDGFKAIEILKSNPSTCSCPVLVLSAKNQEADRERSIQLGAEGYLAKPFTLKTLIEQVENILKNPS